MVLKSNNKEDKNFIHTIPDGWVLFFICCIGGGAYFCGQFFTHQADKFNEIALHTTIDSLKKLPPVAPTYIHDKEGTCRFFPKGETLYMGWLKDVEWGNIRAVSLDTTESGDYISINGKNCRHAIGMFPPKHGVGWVSYKLEGRCSEFKADIILIIPKKGSENSNLTKSYCDTTGKGVIFRVLGDNKLLYEDSIFHYDEPKRVSLKIDSVKNLTLEVEAIAKDGFNWGATSCWANAMVIVK